MSVSLYDEAIVKKITAWLPAETNPMVLKPNEVSRLWQIRADKKNDQPLTLPLVSISRDPSINVDVVGKRALTYDGVKVGKTEQGEVITLDAIPISFSYQIDIFTETYEAGDSYLRNLIFNLVNHPSMKVLIPYNGSYLEHTANLFLQQSLTDNSDIAEKKFPDQFTRWTIRLDVNDAFLFSVPVKKPARVIGSYLDVNGTEQEDADDIFDKDVDLDN